MIIERFIMKAKSESSIIRLVSSIMVKARNLSIQEILRSFTLKHMVAAVKHQICFTRPRFE